MAIEPKPVATEAVYICTSREDKSSGGAVRAQLEACHAVAAAHGWTAGARIYDAGSAE